jgi:hypothetical protein
MLEPWIIEEIRRREREEQERQQPALEIPYWEPPKQDEETTPPLTERGVIVIDL